MGPNTGNRTPVMNREVIAHIAWAMGQLMAVEYNVETSSRVEFV